MGVCAAARCPLPFTGVSFPLPPSPPSGAFSSGRYLSSYNPLLETTVEAQYAIQLP